MLISVIIAVILCQEVLTGGIPDIGYGRNSGAGQNISPRKRSEQHETYVTKRKREANIGMTVNGENEQPASEDATRIIEMISTFIYSLPNVIEAVISHKNRHERSEATDLAKNDDLLRRNTSFQLLFTAFDVIEFIQSSVKNLEQAGIIETPVIDAAVNVISDILNFGSNDEFCDVVCNITDVFESVFHVIVEKLQDLEQAEITGFTVIINSLQDGVDIVIKILNSIKDNIFQNLISDVINLMVAGYKNLERTAVTDITKIISILQDARNIINKKINSSNIGDIYKFSTDIINVIRGDFKSSEQGGIIDQTNLKMFLQDAANVGSKTNCAISSYVDNLARIITNNFKRAYIAVPNELTDLIAG